MEMPLNLEYHPNKHTWTFFQKNFEVTMATFSSYLKSFMKKNNGNSVLLFHLTCTGMFVINTAKKNRLQ
jgi:hypothetical protein